MSNFYMPEELLTKVFTYLPPKSLLRFTCVCKSWQSLITSDSNFITDHLNQTILSNNINNTHLFLIRYLVHSSQEQYSLHIDNNRTFDLYDIIKLPRRSDVDKYFRILGSCNGLICLSDNYVERFISYNAHGAQHCVRKKRVILWNPSIRKYVTLPPPDLDDRFLADETFVHVLGFGFDLRTNDYKVVRITWLNWQKGQSPTVQIYRLSTGSWETITPAIDPSCSVHKSATQAFINGAVHWPASKSKDIGSLILSFDMSDEVFHEIRFPVSVAGNHYGMNTSVVVGGKRLCYLDYGENCNDKSFSIWVMKEYGVVESWTKVYSIDPRELESRGWEKLLGFRRNGELLLALRNNQLVSYNRRARSIKYLGVCDSSDQWTSSSYHVEGYVESLVLLGNDI